MKKVLSILLVITLLTGCTVPYDPSPVETEAPTVQETSAVQPEVYAPTETEPEVHISQLPMVAVSVPIKIETVCAEDGTVIFRQTNQSMQLTMRDPEVADKIIIDFLNRVDSRSQEARDILEASQSAYSDNSDWDSYFHDLIYSPTRVDHGVLSLYGEAVSYSGGNHPQRLCTAANYNMVTGDVLTLGSILYRIDSKASLAELVTESLDATAEEKYLLDGYEDVVRQRFNRDESFDEDWYFTSEGLCFYFEPYEIAPYSSGVITAQIPYSKLTGIIDDAFFPAEADLTEGSIASVHLDRADMEKFTQIAEVILDPEGEMFFLYTTGVVRNLRIHKSIRHDDIGYTQTNTIFGTYTLSPGDAVMLKVSLKDSTDTLHLSYESGGQTHDIVLSSEFLNG